MSEKVLISKSKLTAIGNALRASLNTDVQYSLDDMVTAIYVLSGNYIPVQSVSIQGTLLVDVGSSMSFSKTFTPSNATNKNYVITISDNALVWSGTSTHIEVTSDNKIKGKLAGTAYFKIITNDGNKTSNTCTVTVTQNSGGQASA